MSSNVDECLGIIKKCSLEEKQELLKILKILTCESENDGNSNTNVSNMSTTSGSHGFDKFVSHHRSFIDDSKFLGDLRDELDSLDLYRPNSKKPRTVWLSKTNNSLTNFPLISKLLDRVNEHNEIPKGSLNCCNIVCYSNDKKSLRLHSDNEEWISQSHAIATFSLGVTRRVEFVPLGSSHTNVVRSVDAEHNSLYIMHPGCQSVLQHRVLPGNSANSSDHVRYSISFRMQKPPSTESPSKIQLSEPVESLNLPTQNHTSRIIPATLLIGDSFFERLDATRLGKSKKVVLNLAKGGSKIPDIIRTIEEFSNKADNHKYLVDQVFLSVGTNDIRHCRNGVNNLKGELFGLVRRIKHMFPKSKIFLQSLLPLPITYANCSYVIRNVLDFNRIIYHVCSHERVYIVDVFGAFLSNGHRNPRLFPYSIRDIHPNSRGMATLARFYIDRIHSRQFDPFSPN